MSESSPAFDPQLEILERLREARRGLRVAMMKTHDLRERVFEPARLLRILGAHVEDTAECHARERRAKLFMLTTLLYGALDWRSEKIGVDMEPDVQLERLQQDYRFGGPQADDRLSPIEWRTRMQYQLQRMEQQMAVDELYAMRLVKLTALSQAALESATRQWASAVRLPIEA
jgi:hypothetical protein